MSATDKIVVQREGRIGYLIFNNPELHNAVSYDMWVAASGVLEDFARDGNIGVIVLTGTGSKAFVSGADISKFEDERGTQDAVAQYNDAVDRAYTLVYDFPKPTIAMIRGYCIGGGLGLAVSCDLRIASDHSRFAMPAAKLGLGYDLPGVRRFVEVLGASFTKEMFFTARQFNTAEALVMGLVNKVVPDAEIENYVRDYAATIAANAPLTIASTKFIVGELMKDADDRDLAGCTAYVQRCFESRDYQEGRRAFMEKRKPVFTGT